MLSHKAKEGWSGFNYVRDMSVTNIYRLSEFHPFHGGEREYLYLVPSGAIFALDDLSSAIISRLGDSDCGKGELVSSLTAQGFMSLDIEEAIEELYQSHAITNGNGFSTEIQKPPMPFPLQTLVLNVTNQCNLSCKYCYEFGEDRVATPEGKPKFMSDETARAAVDFLLANSPGRRAVNLTFFGGETLMNFKVVRSTIEYAREQAHDGGQIYRFQSDHQRDAAHSAGDRIPG